MHARARAYDRSRVPVYTFSAGTSGFKRGRDRVFADLSNAICSISRTPPPLLSPSLYALLLSFFAFAFSLFFIYIYFFYSICARARARKGFLYTGRGVYNPGGRPRLYVPARPRARQQFSPPGNLQQFFITRRDNVSACSVLSSLRLLLSPGDLTPSKKVSRRYLRHGRRSHVVGHDNVFIIHWIMRGALAEIRWGRYYAALSAVSNR